MGDEPEAAGARSGFLRVDPDGGARRARDTGWDGARPVTAVEAPFWRLPELADDDRLVGGVAAGIARELGLDPLWVRLGFVVLFAVGGWGALLYGAWWGVMALAGSRPAPADRPDAGGAGAVGPRVAKGRSELGRLVGFGSIVVGLALLAGRLGGYPASVVWPVGVIGVGSVLSWHRVTVADRAGGGGTSRRWLVAIGGLVAVAVVVSVSLVGLDGIAAAAGSILVALGTVLATVLLSAPWWWRLVRERDAERQARVRSQERAEMAAHIHDSVLQTLTLIQKYGDDPQTMLNLARRQERELRNWLDPNRASRRGQSIRGQLDEIATTVEELHGVPVEVVAVGDCLVEGAVEALLGATREAAVNAAKHSGAERIDIYLEVTETGVQVFVRDTGKGFDPESIDDDRQGVRHSILARMARVGGTVVISSEPGDGTEVELRLGEEAA